ncbi:MAG: hypothetical protein ACREUI_09980, partial [Burkholderiales bacterium]
MPLETGNFIADLTITNPPGTDQKREGDDHLRLIKKVIRTSLSGFTGAVVVGGPDLGVANAYVLTPVPALPSYQTGMMVVFKPASTNTAVVATSLSISALGFKEIKTVDGVALVAGDLVVGNTYL